VIDGPYTSRELDLIEDFARDTCHTAPQWADPEGTREIAVTDSGAMGERAELLRTLAENGRFRIIRQRGRMVVGFWPENDPEKKTT